MSAEFDPEFYLRADKFLDVANTLSEKSPAGMVNASFMFSAARFCSWIIALNAKSKEDMIEKKLEMADHFALYFKEMVLEHMSDHISHWDGDHGPSAGVK